MAKKFSYAAPKDCTPLFGYGVKPAYPGVYEIVYNDQKGNRRYFAKWEGRKWMGVASTEFDERIRVDSVTRAEQKRQAMFGDSTPKRIRQGMNWRGLKRNPAEFDA